MELTKEQKSALCQPIDFDILAHIKFQKKISESKFRVPISEQEKKEMINKSNASNR